MATGERLLVVSPELWWPLRLSCRDDGSVRQAVRAEHRGDLSLDNLVARRYDRGGEPGSLVGPFVGVP